MNTATQDRLAGGGLPWVDRLRESGRERFQALGFPTAGLESWRFTNVAPIRRLRFRPAARVEPIPENLRTQVESYASPRCVFVNGALDRQLSSTGDEAHGFHLSNLSEALADEHRAAAVETYLGAYLPTGEHAFAAWNTAEFSDGAYVRIPRGTVVERPLNLVFVSVGTGEPWVCHPRNLIVAGEEAQAAIVEVFLGAPDSPYLTNTVTEITAGSGAVIEHYKLECESARGFHVGVTQAWLDRDASLESHSLSFGGALVRNDLNVVLAGEGSHCTLNGLFVVEGDRLADNHTRVRHQKPYTSSRQLYKGVLAGKGRGVFNGAVTILEDAQKTDAVQYSKNLLLSEDAQINTKPQLEIRANDVRCFHGATIGQMDPEAIFYMKSRGIDGSDARRILTCGFAREVLEGVRVAALRDRVKRLVAEWLAAENPDR